MNRIHRVERMASGWSKEKIARKIERAREETQLDIQHTDYNIRLQQLNCVLVEYHEKERNITKQLQKYDKKIRAKSEYINI